MDAKRIVDFLETAGRLKKLPRTGWVESGVESPESVADHSYRVALLSLLLADNEGLDSLSAVRMALLHDLAEAMVGDLTPRQKKEKLDWASEERKAFSDVISFLPKDLSILNLAAVDEYVAGSSPEAKLVKAADKLEMLLQAHEYEAAGHDPSKLMRFRHVSIEGTVEKEIEREIRRR